MSGGHTGGAHALLSASGASRWLACTPSAQLEEKFNASNPRKSSDYAEEGTLAHELAELELRRALGRVEEKTYKAELRKFKKRKHYSPDMPDYVADYVSLVLGRVAELENQSGELADILIEERLDFSEYVPHGFGTGDTVIHCAGHVDVIDLKYGRGVRVEVEGNPQLRLYGVGALALFPDAHTVRMTVCQPRLAHEPSEQIPAKGLRLWAEFQVKPKARKAIAGEGEKQAGDHCRWCAVKGMCKTLADKGLELAKLDFAEADELDKQQLADIYRQLPMLRDWMKGVEEHILAQALKGEAFDGIKVVEGKSNRTWKDEAEAVEAFKAEGFTEAEYYERKILSPAKAEKLAGKTKWGKLSELVIKPTGAPTLAPMSDRRPPFNESSAEKDFE